MMGDPGTSDSKLLDSSLGIQPREEFHVLAPGSALEPSEPSFSNGVHGQHPLFLPSLQDPVVSFRPVGSEAWSNRDFEVGGSVGPRNFAQHPIQNPISHLGDTLDVTARAGVGEDDLLTYPEREADAVTITARDLASLQPEKFLTDNIIDFYIKYLKVNAILGEHQNQFHFFNSFFFRKLLETTASMGVDECKVDFEQLQKWIGDVNLFEKDFVFIPVIVRLHWSLLVICHLGSLNPSSLGERKGSPCILHLDPLEGKHKSFEGQVKSFIFQAWVEKFEASNNLLGILHSLVQMKYIQAKVLQQGNNHDCGLYILHYIEVFFSKSTSQDLIVSSLEGGAHFIRSNFREEVSEKRNYIRHLIFRLCKRLQVDDGNLLSIQPVLQEEVVVVPSKRHEDQGLSKVVKEIKSKKWKEIETLVLLQCMVEGGDFSKGKLGAMHWDLIAKEINVKNIEHGWPLRSKEQCQNRFDTLLKAFKVLNAYCLKMDKEFCNVSEDEKRSLNLATPLEKKHEVWYNHLYTICVRRSSLKDQSCKRQKPNVDGDMDVDKLVASPINPLQQCPPILERLELKKSPLRQVAIEEFNKLKEVLKYTFLNVIQDWSIKMELQVYYDHEQEMSLEVLCRRLAIVQDQNPLEIRKHIYELRDCKLVALRDICPNEEEWGDCWVDKKWFDISNLDVYKKLGRKVFNKNPHLNTFCNLSSNDVIVTKLCSMQHIKVLSLYECQELENIDLGNFPNLRCLDIMDCIKLEVVNRWEGPKGLGWVKIMDCPSYCDYCDIKFLSSLKEFFFENYGGSGSLWQFANFSQCVQLRRLEFSCNYLVESMDLKALRLLEVLSFSECSALFTIHGLSALQSLVRLNVSGCKSLKTLPHLGYLKALTHLDMRSSGIIEICGVEELHLLTLLNLCGCESLESLPPLGHLKLLAFLDVSWTSIEEIPGVEDLVNLETLDCYKTKLKRLPNLDHLRLLRQLNIHSNPSFTMNPFIRRHELIASDSEGLFVDDISDIEDSEDISFGED